MLSPHTSSHSSLKALLFGGGTHIENKLSHLNPSCYGLGTQDPGIEFLKITFFVKDTSQMKSLVSQLLGHSQNSMTILFCFVQRCLVVTHLLQLPILGCLYHILVCLTRYPLHQDCGPSKYLLCLLFPFSTSLTNNHNIDHSSAQCHAYHIRIPFNAQLPRRVLPVVEPV